MADALLTLNGHEARTAAAIFARLFPGGDDDFGATEIGVVTYLDRALAGAAADRTETYRLGLAALDRSAREAHGHAFADCDAAAQDALLAAMERGELPRFAVPPQRDFFDLLVAHCQEGLFADPAYGGNREMRGWRFLGHPGVWLENSAEEQLSAEPVTKGGHFQDLAAAGFALGGRGATPVDVPGYDPQAGVEAPAGEADVVLVGVGGVGGYIAPLLAEAGLRVVGLEAGPWRSLGDFLPDELGQACYCRGELGPKFLAEAPRWRTDEGMPTRECTYSLGRMMNGVGGSIVHYGAWLRRFHPHHLRYRSHILARWGERAIPAGCTVADWPISYDELEPYLTAVEQEIGLAGDETNPFMVRSKPLPLPPTRPFRLGELFRRATEAMGLHPYPVSVSMNTLPRHGYPETTYCAFNSGFGAWDGDKWHPALTHVPAALATGNFTLRTHCRVLRVVTNGDGRAIGVEYLAPDGRRHLQRAGTVILAAYTFENVRLLFLSADARHPDGLGNGGGQLGRHLMVKQFAHVNGFCPDVVFNRHTGPGAQALNCDDFVGPDFDSVAAGGFVGGASLGAENQYLPIQISREALPPDVPRWGRAYKEHLRQWQHTGVCRIQQDALSYEMNYLDLDPRVRDRSGVGDPVVRVTYDVRPNERRLREYFEGIGAEVVRAMGATRTWPGPGFSGVGSSHELGGCRMSDDPAAGVVDRDLAVHDTPGLFVFSGAAFPTCPGINPTLTLWALCRLATERLIDRLRGGGA